MPDPSDALASKEPTSSTSLTFAAYQRDAARTLNRSLAVSERALDAAAGLAEEAGEVLAHVRKHVFQRRPLDQPALIEELGDALWCLAALATTLDISLGDVARFNLAKLGQRYPDGLDPDRPAR